MSHISSFTVNAPAPAPMPTALAWRSLPHVGPLRWDKSHQNGTFSHSMEVQANRPRSLTARSHDSYLSLFRSRSIDNGIAHPSCLLTEQKRSRSFTQICRVLDLGGLRACFAPEAYRNPIGDNNFCLRGLRTHPGTLLGIRRRRRRQLNVCFGKWSLHTATSSSVVVHRREKRIELPRGLQ